MPYCKIFKSGITIGPTGGVRPCCAIDTTGETEPTFDENWREHHLQLHERSLEDWLPGCAECKLSEDIGRPSLRQHYNKILGGQDLEYWDIKINNTCNLACRMCEKTSSSTWESIIKNNKNLDWDDSYTGTMKTGWHGDIENILPHLSTARFVKFTGGEPFLIPQVKRIIDWLISEDICSNIEELTFITNGTIDITEWFPRFEKFKKVSLLVSIDAVGDRYEYIRSGSKWSALENNIDKIIANKKNNTRLCTTILPMALNCNHIDEVVDWCKQKQIEYNISTPVIKPDFLSPLALTDITLREKLIQQMQIQDKIWNTDYRKFI